MADLFGGPALKFFGHPRKHRKNSMEIPHEIPFETDLAAMETLTGGRVSKTMDSGLVGEIVCPILLGRTSL